jgi:tetratricopeptide (TPR) repeat protein
LTWKPAFVVFGSLALAGVAATVAYQKALRERDYRALLGRGDTAIEQAQPFSAIEAYSGAIALKPESVLAHLRRGETYWQRGDLENASRDFRTAASLDPAAPRPLEEWGDVLYARGRYRRAVEVYEARIRLDSQSPGVLYKLALSRFRDRDIEGALKALSDTLREDDASAEAYYLMGLCLQAQKRTVEAIKAFENAVERAPGMVAAREELADLYASLGRDNEELDQLQLIAGLDRDHTERQVAVGLAHARAALNAIDRPAQERHANLAILTLGSALERTPGQPLIYGTLGRVWLETAIVRNDRVDLRKAIEALERVASTSAATSEVLTLYGRALFRDDQIEAAERVLDQATERFPVDLTAFLEYAAVAERRNHLEAARTALSLYMTLAPAEHDLASPATKIASLSTRIGDLEGAILWLERAQNYAPRDLDVLAALLEAQLRAGRIDDARLTLVRGQRLDPQSPQVSAMAERLRRLPSDRASRGDRLRED